MNRTTVDFGIDLGTTNSAIAVLKDVSTEIVKNNDDQDVTPSAVSYAKNGQVSVGTRARGAIIVKPNDAYAEFKRRMGTEYEYTFKASGLVKKPEELSAEILRSLRADVFRATGEEIQTAVIAVPAAFELYQCDATRKAADLAGLKGSPLLQEPVAAALAYGFQLNSEKAYWLVYDFGGGTFDAALIKADNGLINVVNHGGDNFLGGSDIDWAILEKIIAPKLAQNYDLPDFNRGNNRWDREMMHLKRLVENAKIELTTKESTILEDFTFKDNSDDDVKLEEISLTRSDVVKISEPIIRRSIGICQKVLQQKNLSLSAIHKVILVGGPTKAPYFREILKAGLGISLDHSVDPLTVVAKGAAVFAGTQKIDIKHRRPVKIGEYQVDLNYNPIGHEKDPMIGGKISSPSKINIEGFCIEFVNNKSNWRSGRITLRGDGVFMLNLFAEEGERNAFSIELYDASGSRQKTVPDHLVYTIGAVIEELPLVLSVGVSLVDNQWEKFFEKGSGLPLKKQGKAFRTNKAIKSGEVGDGIIIPIIEGENERADRNRIVGTLEIKSELMKRDLPAGSEVEIKLEINESRLLTGLVYVPTLDEEYKIQFNMLKKAISFRAIDEDYKREIERLRSLMSKAEECGDEKAAIDIRKLQTSDLIKEINDEITAAKGDPGAAEKAEKRLLELKLKLDIAEDNVKWPALVAEIHERLDNLEKLIKQHGSADHVDHFSKIKQQVDDIIRQQQKERLGVKLQHVQQFYYQVQASLPAFWVSLFQALANECPQMMDQSRAKSLFDMGQRYLEQNNSDGLRNVVSQLMELLPKDAQEEVNKVGGTYLTK